MLLGRDLKQHRYYAGGGFCISETSDNEQNYV